MSLPPGIVHPLPLDEPTLICGVEVTPIDANHCPGACMFLFKLPPSPTGSGSSGTQVG
jgi:DNA cross-link repair 1A protein